MYPLDLFTFLHPVKSVQASLISQRPLQQSPCLFSFLFIAVRMILLNTDVILLLFSFRVFVDAALLPGNTLF